MRSCILPELNRLKWKNSEKDFKKSLPPQKKILWENFITFFKRFLISYFFWNFEIFPKVWQLFFEPKLAFNFLSRLRVEIRRMMFRKRFKSQHVKNWKYRHRSRANVLHRAIWGQFHKTLWIRKLRICSYGQILTVNLLINWKNSVIYGEMAVNYEEKSFME